MATDHEKKLEVMLNSYKADIRDIYKRMTFYYFENKKPYSFDYLIKPIFDVITDRLHSDLEGDSLPLSSSLSNKLPIFLPPQTSRIAFFSYTAKSVRAIKISELKALLTKQAEKRSKRGEFPSSQITNLVLEDLKTFEHYHKEHTFEAYRRDIATPAVQFNAYDDKDNLLIEKSFVKGGLVFEMKEEDFVKKVTVTYPRYRKQRSDKIDAYIPLKLIKIRGLEKPQVS